MRRFLQQITSLAPPQITPSQTDPIRSKRVTFTTVMHCPLAVKRIGLLTCLLYVCFAFVVALLLLGIAFALYLLRFCYESALLWLYLCVDFALLLL